MKVIVIAKEPFEMKTLVNVSMIELLNGNYVLTVGSLTYTYAKANYSIMVV